MPSPLPYFCNVEGLFVILLSLCLTVGLLVLLTVVLHYVQWKRTGRQAAPSVTLSTDNHSIFQEAIKPLSNIEKKYLLLFLEGKSTEEISAAMHVEPSSVYTMKYRIRKKFAPDFRLRF